MIDGLVFCFGAIFGSFLNVCITRIPVKKSIISLPSHCPHCGKQIRVYHNIPILSYVLLKGQCAYCHWKIPNRYFLVEVLTGLVFLLLYINFGFQCHFFYYAVICCIFIVISFIDLEHQLILNRVLLFGGVAGATLAISIHTSPFEDLILGAGIGGGFLLLIAWIGQLLFRKESMGGGDIKYAVLIGSLLGVQGVVITLGIAIITAAIVGSIYLKVFKIHYLPFGPYLSFGAFAYILYGNKVIDILYVIFS
ncbi:prepilin peptidase [candidate division KSB1 bacterium]|nr:prepilin peptidase [candidate division KSB1 bacterium]